MDTLSSSVSTIKLVPATAPPPRHTPSSSSTSRKSIHHHFRSRRPSTSSQHQLISSSSGSVSSSALRRPSEARSSSLNIPHAASLHPEPASPVLLQVQHHRRAASGYAAALIDVAQTDGSLQLLQRDVGRLSRLLQNTQLQEVLQEPSLSAPDKGAILREIMRASGARKKFHRHLVALLNMLVGKDKLHLMAETLDEFGRIYAALSWKTHTPLSSPP